MLFVVLAGATTGASADPAADARSSAPSVGQDDLQDRSPAATISGPSFMACIARFFGAAGASDDLVRQDGGPLRAERLSRVELIEPPPFPWPERLRAARRWLAGRQGYLGFAVVDSDGKLHGRHVDRTFMSGSVTKAMLLVEYLRTYRDIGPGMGSVLTRMITESDNDAADTVFFAVGGDQGLRNVAAAANMDSFVADRGYWGYATITAGDQARFFFAFEKLVPKRHRDLARRLLSGVVEWQSYGIPAVARPDWEVFFKGGWRTGLHGGRLLHQVARLEQGDTVFSIAVLMDGVPSEVYGMETLEGVTKRLLGE